MHEFILLLSLVTDMIFICRHFEGVKICCEWLFVEIEYREQILSERNPHKNSNMKKIETGLRVLIFSSCVHVLIYIHGYLW